jgi:hypothetical protein
MDEAGNVIDTKDTKWKTLGQGVATSVVAAFEPSIAGKVCIESPQTTMLT